MSKFAGIKFVTRPDAVFFSTEKGHSIHEKCVECRAWNEISSIKAMANPDYRERGYGATIEEAKKDAVRAVNEAHRKWMLSIHP